MQVQVQVLLPRELRAHQVIFEAGNVLEPRVLREMARVRRRVAGLTAGGLRWQDVCLRVPIVTKPECLDNFSLFDSFFGRRRREVRGREGVEKVQEGQGSKKVQGVEEVQETGEEQVAEGVEGGKCDGVEPPDLSNYTWADLVGVKYRMESEGFTPQLGQCQVVAGWLPGGCRVVAR